MPVPERAPRDISLRVEGTPRDRRAHDHLLEENKRYITIQKALGRAPAVSAPEITLVDRALRANASVEDGRWPESGGKPEG